ncbi:hypothetical protein [Parasitella parasitica]|uniref:Uncharacterized protein n=1 Tax=Parasitella parasitica TaxID=35722 RepID=A0A0B7NF01_9FUNG|nr:hypothetical protein [Parasitella parasitica]
MDLHSRLGTPSYENCLSEPSLNSAISAPWRNIYIPGKEAFGYKAFGKTVNKYITPLCKIFDTSGGGDVADLTNTSLSQVDAS